MRTWTQFLLSFGKRGGKRKSKSAKSREDALTIPAAPGYHSLGGRKRQRRIRFTNLNSLEGRRIQKCGRKRNRSCFPPGVVLCMYKRRKNRARPRWFSPEGEGGSHDVTTRGGGEEVLTSVRVALGLGGKRI